MSHLHQNDEGGERGGGLFNDTGRKGGKKGKGKASVRDRMIVRQVYGKEGIGKKEKNLIPLLY